MDGGVRTAVEGVDPREPGQATGTEGLHPPFLSLSQSLCFCLISSVLFCCWLFTSSLFFFLILEKQPSSRRKKQKESFGKKCQKTPRGPTGRQTSERVCEPKKECMSEWCVCVHERERERERKQQAGDDHRRPLLGEERSTPSLSLACSLTPIHPSSLSLSLDSARIAHQPLSPSLSYSWHVSLSLSSSRGRNSEAMHNDCVPTRLVSNVS